jgi:hypothetical protein
MSNDRDDQAPNAYVFGETKSEHLPLLLIANDLAELRRLTAERNELLRESNARFAKDDEIRHATLASFDRAAELEERLAKTEKVLDLTVERVKEIGDDLAKVAAVAPPPVAGLARADDVEKRWLRLDNLIANLTTKVDEMHDDLATMPRAEAK